MSAIPKMSEGPRIPIPQSVRPAPLPDVSSPAQRPGGGGGGRGDGSDGGRTPGNNVHSFPNSLTQSPAEKGYSFFLRLMKLLLPVLAILLIGLVVTWPQLNKSTNQFSMGFTQRTVSGDEAPNMVRARFTGIDDQSRPYSLTADHATQVGDSPEIVSLDRPQADVSLADGSWAALSSKHGIFSETTQILGLREDVNLYHDAGYEFYTSSADIDLATGTASGGEAVLGQGPFGHVKSEGFLILNRGQRIVFTGKTHLVIFQNKIGASQ